MRILKKTLSIVLSLTMVMSLWLMSTMSTSAASMPNTGSITNNGDGQVLQNNTIYNVTSNTTCRNLQIASNATVTIYIPSGVTLTCNGDNASGTTGGRPGILLPSGSTLYVMGSGTLKATGGNAANGETGSNGEKFVLTDANGDVASIGYGGKGGAGGGGAGAGIGTAGRNWWNRWFWRSWNRQKQSLRFLETDSVS